MKLIYEKGKYIPVIKEYDFQPISYQKPNKKFARFIQIGPSDIQTDPINRKNNEGEICSLLLKSFCIDEKSIKLFKNKNDTIMQKNTNTAVTRIALAFSSLSTL